jgi:hypothetical protein
MVAQRRRGLLFRRLIGNALQDADGLESNRIFANILEEIFNVPSPLVNRARTFYSGCAQRRGEDVKRAGRTSALRALAFPNLAEHQGEGSWRQNSAALRLRFRYNSATCRRHAHKRLR